MHYWRRMSKDCTRMMIRTNRQAWEGEDGRQGTLSWWGNEHHFRMKTGQYLPSVIKVQYTLIDLLLPRCNWRQNLFRPFCSYIENVITFPVLYFCLLLLSFQMFVSVRAVEDAYYLSLFQHSSFSWCLFLLFLLALICLTTCWGDIISCPLFFFLTAYRQVSTSF